MTWCLTPQCEIVPQRYYGKSLPFGGAAFVPNNIRYLTVEQALADYALLIGKLKEDFKITKVITFGGR